MRADGPLEGAAALAVTRRLARWCAGERDAFAQLFPVLYPEMRRPAQVVRFDLCNALEHSP